MKPDAFVVMGVSGSGKSTVGRNLAKRLGSQYFDADDYHSSGNVRKMRSGVPLDDADRAPWLETLNQLLVDHIKAGRKPVLACSALKNSYRQKLISGGLHVAWIYLRGNYEELLGRMEFRENHFMPASLLRSQLEALEEPADAWTFEISRPVEEIVEAIVSRLNFNSREDS
jgi:gluconokinase